MTNLKEIEENYKSFPDGKLLKLAATPKELPRAVVQVLEKELISRGETDKAQELRDYLEGKTKQSETLSELSQEELEQMVADRLETGEPMESIILDFKDNNLDINDIMGQEYRKKEAIFNYMTSVKSENIVDGALISDVQETFLITEEEAQELDAELKNRGKSKESNAYIWIAVAVLIMCVVAITSGVVVLPIGLILLCISLLYRASIQKK